MEFLTAVKDRVLGAVEENVGYFTGNQEMEQKGHELRESAGNNDNSSNNQNLSAVAQLRDAHHEAILNQNDDKSSSDSSSSFSMNPSLFSRNQPDPETSAHGAAQSQQHTDTIPHWEPVSRDVMDKPVVAPINTDASALSLGNDQWSNKPSEDSVGSKWMEKLGSIMSGADKNEASSFWRTPESTQEKKEEWKDDRTVVEKLRDAHADAVASPQQPSMTETIKEKFDNWSQSASNALSGANKDEAQTFWRSSDLNNEKNDRGMTENVQEKMTDMKETVQERVGDMKDSVQEKVGDMKDQVDSMWNKNVSGSKSNVDPLPVKHDATADIPDPVFIQNA